MAQVDPATIAQTGYDPVTGSPLSAEVRKALFRRTVSPSSIFGGGGSLVRRTDDSSALVVAQTQQITQLQDQLNVLRVEVSVINNGLQNIAQIVRQDGILEEQRLRTEQESERRNLEQEVRLGKENQLEQKIQAAIARPIVALQKKVTNIFGNIMGALTTLFAGWLTNQGIETLKALEEGNKEKLKEIKDTVIKNTLYAIGALAAIKIGFGLVIRSVVSLAVRVGGLAARLALAPLRFLGNKLRGIPGAVGRLFGGGGAGASRSAAAAASGGVRPRGGGGFGLLGGAISFGSNLAEGKGVGESASAAGGGMAGSWALAKTGAAAGSILGPKGAAVGGVLGGIAGFFGGEKVGAGIYNKFFGKGENNLSQQSQSQPAVESPKSAPAPTPQATIMPQASELSLSTPTPSASEVSEFQSEAGKNMMDINVDSSKSYSVPSLISSQTMQNIPSTSPNIGALPDPQPNVVMLPSTQRKRQQQMISGSSGGSDVPLISSSNPDNFYVLYSQLNYNVVM
jgi:hypothetical protein